ncbi:hypothetical protein [Sphingobium xenophagum]|uniref:hypothetical protein n=1 Tax=Sphingobium xenophagum TaxID=121428 RepID=UPI00037DC2FF|nr:hypothetical protein [Sphingobium xenophagum]
MADRDLPVAWMLRAARAAHTRSARQYGEFRVLCGQVFMSEATAAAAAERQSNSWRKAEAFPVFATPSLPADVVALVVAAREAWEFLQESYPTYAVTGALDKSLEAFASRVCYDDEDGELQDAHADPCTCGNREASNA